MVECTNPDGKECHSQDHSFCLTSVTLFFTYTNILFHLCCIFPDCCPLAFGIPLSQVIANDRAHKQMQEAVKGNRRVWLEVEASVTEFRTQIQKKSPLGGSCVRSYEVLTDEPLSPIFLDRRSQSQRRVELQIGSMGKNICAGLKQKKSLGTSATKVTS